ncbi:hypothetical protein B0H14DRAFT_3503639 [Mycena olivaceomarginata]|nr:hypothetical protein B0H14DRAFT_3503639 [Mycena olivaceomarginata]
MDSLPPHKKRLFSPKAEVCTGLLVFSNFPSEIIRDVPGFHTDQERHAHVRRVLQQCEALRQATGHRRMILQISLLDELIACSRSEHEKAHAILWCEQKEAQDCMNYETWRIAHPPPPPRPFESCIAVGSALCVQNPSRRTTCTSTMPALVTYRCLSWSIPAASASTPNPTPSSYPVATVPVSFVTWRPQLDVEEVATIERAYPGWDQSKIVFGWEGLSFPAARC